MDSVPIEDYALLSDCHSAALVGRNGSVDWLCFPRFDSPAVFARLLDQGGGHFAVRPAGEFQVSRRYLEQSLVLETTFSTPAGSAVLTDAMATGSGERGHDLGIGSPGALLRRIECTTGEVEIDVSYAPRPEYGLIHPVFEPVSGGLIARGGATRLVLSAPAAFRVDQATATARLRLAAGQAAGFAPRHGLMWQPLRLSAQWRSAAVPRCLGTVPVLPPGDPGAPGSRFTRTSRAGRGLMVPPRAVTLSAPLAASRRRGSRLPAKNIQCAT